MLTLTREDIEIDYLSGKEILITDGGVTHDVRSGYAYGGPRFSSLNRYANVFGNTNTGSSANTFQNLSGLRITGTKTSLDGQQVLYFY